MDTRSIHDELRKTLDAQLRKARALRELPLELLETRPAPGRWSVLEVCEHMVLSSGHYLRHLRAAYSDPRVRFSARPSHSPGFWGGLLTRTMQPREDGRIPLPMATMRMFEPLQAPAKRLSALDDLITLLEGFRSLLEEAAERGMSGPRITSTLGPVFRFKVADAFRFATAHQERHLLQIERTLAALRA
jgi:hypothetical protein